MLKTPPRGYLNGNEKTFEDIFERVSNYYGSDKEHAQRLNSYMNKRWFMPSTPILANGGTYKGLPISCFLSEIQDSIDNITDTHKETAMLSSYGGGVAVNYSNIRESGATISNKGKTPGIMPFINIQDAQAKAFNQGNVRNGATVVYINIWHPEVEKIIKLRNFTNATSDNKQALHCGIVIDDKFIEAVKKDDLYDLISSHTNQTIKQVKARELLGQIMEARLSTGEPYIVFIDNVNNKLPKHHKELGLKVKMSNLCSEILLPTGIDYQGKERTAVCCLSSINLAKWDEIEKKKQFVYDILLFLDNVLQDFINKTENKKGFERARYSAMMERSVGLGVMGLADYLQQHNIAFDSEEAKQINNDIFTRISSFVEYANFTIGDKFGSNNDNLNFLSRRFSYTTAIAPTNTISTIAGCSPSIEPCYMNIYSKQTPTGTIEIKNKNLEKLLIEYNKNTDEVWQSIGDKFGSVRHLDFLTEHEKNVFKTAFEIDQKDIIKLAGDRQEHIDQGQSLNLFYKIPADEKEHKPLIKKMIKHFMYAHQIGVKTLYYQRNLVEQKHIISTGLQKKEIKACSIDNPDCEACQ